MHAYHNPVNSPGNSAISHCMFARFEADRLCQDITDILQNILVSGYPSLCRTDCERLTHICSSETASFRYLVPHSSRTPSIQLYASSQRLNNRVLLWNYSSQEVCGTESHCSFWGRSIPYTIDEAIKRYTSNTSSCTYCQSLCLV